MGSGSCWFRPEVYGGRIRGMPKRKRDTSIVNHRFDKLLIGFLRYKIFERDYWKRYAVRGRGARLVDVAYELDAKEEDVWRAIETSTHSSKGRRYWWDEYQQDTRVGPV